MRLRDYQEQAIQKLRGALAKGHKRICFQLPTGGGKTILSAYMIKGALSKGLKVLFLVHLKELIDQTAEKLKLFDIDYGLIAAGEPVRQADCQLAMIQTLARRQKQMEFKPDLIIVDEMHHSVSKTYKQVIAEYPDAKLIGLTATPERLDGKGLKDIVEMIVQGPTMRSLIDAGYLNQYDYYSAINDLNLDDVKTSMGDFDHKQLDEAIEKSSILGDVVGHYKQHLAGKKAIVFCVNIKHSKRVCSSFIANGIPAAHLDGELSKQERKQIISDFKAGKILVLTNCSLISEGFDVPDLDGVIMLRPTKSLGMFLQMVGRGLRKSDNPTVILDHVKNYERHGMPDDERVWSLEGKQKRAKAEVVEYKLCKTCFIVYHPRYKECPNCKAPNESNNEKNIIEKTDVSLVKIKDYKVSKKSSKYLEFLAIAKQRGYKKGWAWHKMQEYRKRNGRN